MRLAYEEGVAFRKDMYCFMTADWNLFWLTLALMTVG
jgi:hypothetical protein